MGYKGRISYSEAINMPNRSFHALYTMLQEKAISEEGKEQLAGENISDELEDIGGI